jgi:hypothetical protein
MTDAQAKHEHEIDVFKRMVEALSEIEGDDDKERILRSVALLAGMEFIEDQHIPRRKSR